MDAWSKSAFAAVRAAKAQAAAVQRSDDVAYSLLKDSKKGEPEQRAAGTSSLSLECPDDEWGRVVHSQLEAASRAAMGKHSDGDFLDKTLIDAEATADEFSVTENEYKLGAAPRASKPYSSPKKGPRPGRGAKQEVVLGNVLEVDEWPGDSSSAGVQSARLEVSFLSRLLSLLKQGVGTQERLGTASAWILREEAWIQALVGSVMRRSWASYVSAQPDVYEDGMSAQDWEVLAHIRSITLPMAPPQPPGADFGITGRGKGYGEDGWLGEIIEDMFCTQPWTDAPQLSGRLDVTRGSRLARGRGRASRAETAAETPSTVPVANATDVGIPDLPKPKGRKNKVVKEFHPTSVNERGGALLQALGQTSRETTDTAPSSSGAPAALTASWKDQTLEDFEFRLPQDAIRELASVALCDALQPPRIGDLLRLLEEYERLQLSDDIATLVENLYRRARTWVDDVRMLTVPSSTKVEQYLIAGVGNTPAAALGYGKRREPPADAIVRRWEREQPTGSEADAMAEIVNLLREAEGLGVELGTACSLLKSSCMRYCVCRRSAEGFMVQCDVCGEWYHGACVDVREEDIIADSTKIKKTSMEATEAPSKRQRVESAPEEKKEALEQSTAEGKEAEDTFEREPWTCQGCTAITAFSRLMSSAVVSWARLVRARSFLLSTTEPPMRLAQRLADNTILEDSVWRLAAEATEVAEAEFRPLPSIRGSSAVESDASPSPKEGPRPHHFPKQILPSSWVNPMAPEEEVELRLLQSMLDEGEGKIDASFVAANMPSATSRTTAAAASSVSTAATPQAATASVAVAVTTASSTTTSTGAVPASIGNAPTTSATATVASAASATTTSLSASLSGPSPVSAAASSSVTTSASSAPSTTVAITATTASVAACSAVSSTAVTTSASAASSTPAPPPPPTRPSISSQSTLWTEAKSIPERVNEKDVQRILGRMRRVKTREATGAEEEDTDVYEWTISVSEAQRINALLRSDAVGHWLKLVGSLLCPQSPAEAEIRRTRRSVLYLMKLAVESQITSHPLACNIMAAMRACLWLPLALPRMLRTTTVTALEELLTLTSSIPLPDPRLQRFLNTLEFRTKEWLLRAEDALSLRAPAPLGIFKALVRYKRYLPVFSSLEADMIQVSPLVSAPLHCH